MANTFCATLFALRMAILLVLSQSDILVSPTVVLKKYVMHTPVFPVFFMVVWLEDSALNFSSISSWYSSETTACSSVISTGDWFVAAHSGYEAAQPLGPWLPAEKKPRKLMKNLDLSPETVFVQVL